MLTVTTTYLEDTALTADPTGPMCAIPTEVMFRPHETDTTTTDLFIPINTMETEGMLIAITTATIMAGTTPTT